MKSWLKGGLIGIGVWVAVILILILNCSFGSCVELGCLSCALLASIFDNPILLFGMFGSLATYFLIGAALGFIIGWIIKAVKSKKVEVTKK
ncbi:hypothetical protein HOA55_01365 [archaeon]|jgi:ribose/xylose/arabinose/galactoside ABC-type transport system permease subunit|nr:hypothetical protein [archaeon]MBT3578045.1 hypothetical protein [archaeon]MBT6819982.1 hypothetical protein [archaeon]MBT6956636.1 hypothetical protein [archaeon]MBT7025019.1 hypothetical protein [archaeon]